MLITILHLNGQLICVVFLFLCCQNVVTFIIKYYMCSLYTVHVSYI